MCHWMGSHFHDWIDYNGVAFSIELLECGRTFSDFWGEDSSSYLRFVLQMKSNVFFFQSKNGSIHKK